MENLGLDPIRFFGKRGVPGGYIRPDREDRRGFYIRWLEERSRKNTADQRTPVVITDLSVAAAAESQPDGEIGTLDFIF